MKLLVVEDEKSLQESIKEFFIREKFVVECASNYLNALEKITLYEYDCIILDIMLPGGSGLQLLEELKMLNKKERIIIVSAKDSIEDKVLGFDLGADDYLAKPFHLAELNARVKSLIRRNMKEGSHSIRLDNIELFPDKRIVFVNLEELPLNRKEFDLLYYFMSNCNRLINKTSLAEFVWGDNIDQADSLDFLYSQVKNLRKKLAAAGAVPEIKAIYGFGYKFCDSNT